MISRACVCTQYSPYMANSETGKSNETQGQSVILCAVRSITSITLRLAPREVVWGRTSVLTLG